MDRTSETSLYQYFDRRGILIYVGITSRGIARNVEHNTSKPWWPHVARQQVTHFPDRTAAEAAERAMIETFRPPFNVQHNADHRLVRQAYESVIDLAVDTPPVEQVRAIRGQLPLVPYRQTESVTTFRSTVEHADIVCMIEPTCTAKVCDTTGVRIGHVDTLTLNGPFLLVHLRLRKNVEADAMTAKLKQVARKGPITFAVRSLHASLISTFAV